MRLIVLHLHLSQAHTCKTQERFFLFLYRIEIMMIGQGETKLMKTTSIKMTVCTKEGSETHPNLVRSSVNISSGYDSQPFSHHFNNFPSNIFG